MDFVPKQNMRMYFSQRTYKHSIPIDIMQSTPPKPVFIKFTLFVEHPLPPLPIHIVSPDVILYFPTVVVT